MLIFLYGQDTYRSGQKLEEIINRHKEVRKSGLNLKFFSGKNLNYQEFKGEFRQSPMFQEKKMLILKDIFQNQEFKKDFLADGKNFADSQDIVIFYEAKEVSPKDPLLKFLIKNAKTQEFSRLSGSKLRSWAQKEFDKRKAVIQPGALHRLIEYAGDNLWGLSNEIQKMSSFKKNKTIELKDVDLLVRPEIETDIFKTIEALALKNKKMAASLIYEHLEKGDNPLYLLSMINFQFRNILVFKKTGQLSGHPYFVRKTASIANGFTLEELKEIYGKIFETDVKIKTGRLDPQTALDLLIADI